MNVKDLVQINPEYLKEIVRKFGISQKQFSKSLGRYDKFIANVLYRGSIQKPAARMLCKMYDSNFDLLCPKPVDVQKQEAKVGNASNTDFSINEIGYTLMQIEALLKELLKVWKA